MERVTLPAGILDNCTLPMLALDAGSTATKVLYVCKEEDAITLEQHIFPTNQFEKVLKFVKEELLPKVPALSAGGAGTLPCTGAQASSRLQNIGDTLRVKVNVVDKFVCTTQAFVHLCQYLPQSCIVDKPPEAAIRESILVQKTITFIYKTWTTITPLEFPIPEATFEPEYWYDSGPIDEGVTYAETSLFPCILSVVGSALTNFKVFGKGQNAQYLEHSPRCGSSFLALVGLTTGIRDYSKVMQMASEGNSDAIDSLFNEVSLSVPKMEDQSEDSNPSVLAYSWGKTVGKHLGDFRQEDVIRGLLTLTTGDIVESVMSAALHEECSHVVFAGSFVQHPTVRHELTKSMMFKKTQVPKERVTFEFVKLGSHLGALGALVMGSSQ